MNVFYNDLANMLTVRERYANELDMTNSTLCNCYSAEQQKILNQRAKRLQEMIEKITRDILLYETELLKNDEKTVVNQ